MDSSAGLRDSFRLPPIPNKEIEVDPEDLLKQDLSSTTSYQMTPRSSKKHDFAEPLMPVRK